MVKSAFVCNTHFLSLFLLMIAIFAGFPGKLKSQCCSAGNPIGSNIDQSSLKKYQFRASLGYKTSYSDTYYQGDKSIEIPDVDHSYYNFFDFQLTYGITKRLNVQTTLGYFMNKGQIYKDPSYGRVEGRGLGDLSLGLKYMVYKNRRYNIEITPSAGVNFPVGKFDQVVNEVVLPINLQPSSGSIKYFASLYAYKGFLKNKVSVFTFFTFETAQTITSRNFYYKYGNLYTISLSGSYNFYKSLTAILQVRSENRNKSMREDAEIIESSGYNVVYLGPQICYSFLKNFNGSILFDWPLYKSYNGIQMGNKLAFSCRLSYTFSIAN